MSQYFRFERNSIFGGGERSVKGELPLTGAYFFCTIRLVFLAFFSSEMELFRHESLGRPVWLKG